ncbi:MAG TPA: AsmA family protein, partial [Methylovirgula sp.]
MRESLTVLAGVLVLILSAALIVPYFIDWNAQRGLVERQLSDVLARSVKIRGAIDLKLLPTPYLRLADVEVGNEAAKRDIKVDELQLEIALTALLRGEVDFVEAKFVRPRLALAIENGTLPLGAPIRHLSGPMRFERISVEDGALDLADPATGRSYDFRNISFSAEAASLNGPFKAEGQLDVGGVPCAFHLGTGERHDDRMHMKLVVDETNAHPGADLDADLIFAKAATSLPSLDGQIKLAGHTHGAIVLPWRLTSNLK